MSSADIALSFDEMLKGSCRDCPAVLRFALRRGEALRLPPGQRNICVLAGTAWVSRGGKDLVIPRGQRMELGRVRDAAVVSAIGGDGVCFEVW